MQITFLLFICIGLIQCDTDDSINGAQLSTSDTAVKKRTCSPGSYSIINGRIAFDDNEDYVATIDFLSCASEEEILDWSKEFEIETAGKSYRSFVTLLEDEELTAQDFLDYMDLYEGKVTFYEIEDDDVNYEPLYSGLHEICNLDGEFQVGDAIIKVTESKIISITDPIAVDPSEVDDETVTDTLDGLFVNILNGVTLASCCEASDSEVHQYGSGPRKRLSENYQLKNATIITYLSGGQFKMTPLIFLVIDSKSQKKGFLGIGWSPFPTSTSLSFDAEFTHNFTPSISSPVVLEYSIGPAFNWGYTAYAYISATYTSNALFRPNPNLLICVTEVLETFTNNSASVSVEIDCD